MAGGGRNPAVLMSAVMAELRARLADTASDLSVRIAWARAETGVPTGI